MDTTQLATSKGFIKAAMGEGMTPMQALAFYKLAFTEGALPSNLVDQLASSKHTQNYVHNDWMRDGRDALKNTPLEGAAGAATDAFGGVALGTGGLGLMYLLHANAKKREREEKAQYPTRVTYGG